MKFDKITIIKIVLEIIVIAAVAMGLFFGITSKKLNINTLFVPGTSTKGMVVGEDQGDATLYELANAGASYMYFRLTRGDDVVDSKYKTRIREASEMYVTKGALHEFTFDADGKAQAKHYIKNVWKFVNGDLYPAVEVSLYDEYKKTPPSKTKVTEQLTDFLVALEKEYKVKPVIRATPEIFRDYLDEGFEDYPRWAVSELLPVYFFMGVDWLMWQYTDSEKYTDYDGNDHIVNKSFVNWRSSISDITFSEIEEEPIEEIQEEVPANEQPIGE